MKIEWRELIEKYITLIIFLIFAYLFFKLSRYIFSFLTLGLFLIAQRLDSIKKLSINTKGLIAEFTKKGKKMSEIIKSKKSISEKINESQELIDEVFKLGFISGGGSSLNNIFNVKIIRDKQGRVTGYQYDEN